MSPLQLAIAHDSTEISQILLDRGSLADSRDVNVITPLMAAVELEQLQQATLLVSSGADVNAIDSNGATPLHKAVFFGNVDIVRLLLNNGALHKVVALDHSPRSLAEAKGHNEIVELLDKHDSERDSQSADF